MKILYAGDSTVPGPANYLLGALNSVNASVRHVPPGKTLSAQVTAKPFDAFILSDFSRADLPLKAEKLMTEQVSHGAGLLMVGGWGSFQGPFGKWRGSKIEAMLPVRCLKRDDRRNISSGLVIIQKDVHPVLRGIRLKQAPVICGLNEVRPKKNGKVILAASEIQSRIGRGHPQLSLAKKEYPLLIVDGDPRRRIAAFTTDFAPHWCGGLVDWGRKRVTLPVSTRIRIEVGNDYVRFLANLIKWLTGN